MITITQLEQISRKLKTNITVVAREYLQLVFLQHLYDQAGSEEIFFKGGTAVRFIYGGWRFSEDLDFTCERSEAWFDALIPKVVKQMQFVVPKIQIKPRKTIDGRGFLLTLEKGVVPYPIYVQLDISFREQIIQKERQLIRTDFPIIFSSFLHHMGAQEILAEKTRAIFTRNKGRDIFDLWYLLNNNYELNLDMIEKKMAYYPKITFSWTDYLEKIQNFDRKQFRADLNPFISLDRRPKLDDLFEVIQTDLAHRLKKL